MTALTPDQFESLLRELKSSIPIDQACRHCRIDPRVLRSELESNSQLAELVDDAIAAGRGAQQQARTYDDPVDNTGRDEPPPPAYEEKKKRGRKSKSDEQGEKPGLDWDRAKEESSALASGMFGCFLWVNSKCAAAGSHVLSPWWRDTMRDYHASGKRWWVGRVGRGAGKSTTLVREAITETMFGERKVPLGQIWPWIFMSVSTGDAATRIVEASAILGALGVEFTQQRTIGRLSLQFKDVNGNDVQFLSLASRIGSLSGPTAIGVSVDEEAKFFNKSGAANQDTEVLTSAIQTLRGRSDAKGIRCSSAWSTIGTHASSIELGDNSQNFVARIGAEYLERAIEGLNEVANYLDQSCDITGAKRVREYAATVTAQSPNVPTWVANPTREAVECYQSNEALAAGEGIPLIDFFLRENASLPFDGAATGSKFDPDYILRCNQQLRSERAAIETVTMTGAVQSRGNPVGVNTNGLISHGSLPSYDPRSARFRLGQRSGKPTM